MLKLKKKRNFVKRNFFSGKFKKKDSHLLKVLRIFLLILEIHSALPKSEI